MPPPSTAPNANTMEDVFKHLIEFIKKSSPPAETGETDPLRKFVEERVGKPPSTLSWDRTAVVKEPHYWLLLFDSKVGTPGNATRVIRETDFRDEFGGPGRLLSAWQARATAIWTEGISDASVAAGQVGRVSTLGGLMSSMASVWFNHPVAKGVPHLLTSLEPLLENAEAVIAVLDEVFISATIGSRQGAEFKRLRGMSARRFGPRNAEIVSRLSFREPRTGHDDDDGGDHKPGRKGHKGGSKRIPPQQWAKMSDSEKKAHIDKRKKEKK